MYYFFIALSMVLMAGLNIAFNPTFPWWVYPLVTLAFTVAVVAVDGLTAFVVRRFPEKWMNYKKRVFTTSKRETKFYEAIGIKKWKDKVPELGGFTNFHKNKISDPKNPAFLERYILEACYGIEIHLLSVFTSFLILLLDFKAYSGESNLFLTIALPVALVSAIYNCLSLFILKYNLPKLTKIYEFLKAKEEKKQRESSKEQ